MSRLARAWETIEELCGKGGLLRPRDLDGTGVSRAWLERMCWFKVIEKIGPGLYARPAASIPDTAIAAKRAPGATVCLASALWMHGLLEAEPGELWLAVPGKARLPRMPGLAVRFVRVSGCALHQGVELHHLGRVEVRVYSVAKSIVDCYRFRRKVGEQIGPDALARALRAGRCTPEDVEEIAAQCRARTLLAPDLRRLATSPRLVIRAGSDTST